MVVEVLDVICVPRCVVNAVGVMDCVNQCVLKSWTPQERKLQ